MACYKPDFPDIFNDFCSANRKDFSVVVGGWVVGGDGWVVGGGGWWGVGDGRWVMIGVGGDMYYYQ